MHSSHWRQRSAQQGFSTPQKPASLCCGLCCLAFGPLQASEKVAKVGFIAGTIVQEKVNSFERLLFRATRGNLLLRTAPIDTVRDPATGEMQKKSVFTVFFSGERSRAKIVKVRHWFIRGVGGGLGGRKGQNSVARRVARPSWIC